MSLTSYYGSLPEPLHGMQASGPVLVIFLRHFG
jgi:hypothetical protein